MKKSKNAFEHRGQLGVSVSVHDGRSCLILAVTSFPLWLAMLHYIHPSLFSLSLLPIYPSFPFFLYEPSRQSNANIRLGLNVAGSGKRTNSALTPTSKTLVVRPLIWLSSFLSGLGLLSLYSVSSFVLFLSHISCILFLFYT